jgi:hypothetical protein
VGISVPRAKTKSRAVDEYVCSKGKNEEQKRNDQTDKSK